MVIEEEAARPQDHLSLLADSGGARSDHLNTNTNTNTVLEQEAARKLTASFCAVGYTVLLGDTARGIMFPILSPLITQLEQSKTVLGVAVGLFSAGRLISSPYFGWLADKHGTYVALVASSIIIFCGAFVFSMVRASKETSIGTLMVAQLLLGIGSGTLGVTRAYYAENSSKEHKTLMLARLTALQYVGFTVMPVVGTGLTKLGSLIHKAETADEKTPYFTEYNMPAVFMMFMSIAQLLFMHFAFDRERDAILVAENKRKEEAAKKMAAELEMEPKQHAETNDIEATTTSVVDKQQMSSEEKTTMWVLGCLMLLNVSTKGSIAVYETLGASYGYTYIGMSAVTLSSLFSGAGACGTLTLLSFQWLCKVFNDVKLILGGVAVMIVAAALLTNSSGANATTFYSSIALMYTIGYPIGHTAVLGLFSKVSKKTKQGLLLGYFASAGSFARVIFPVFSGVISQTAGDSAAFTTVVVVLCISIVGVFLARKWFLMFTV